MKDIEGYEGLYAVTNDGRVWSFPKKYSNVKGGRWLVPNPQRGYSAHHLTKGGKTRRHQTHRLVAIAYLSNPSNLPQVNHKDGNKMNNRVENLEWCSAYENRRHAIENGLWNCRGERGVQAKLTECAVREIREKYAWQGKGGLSTNELGKLYGVSGVLIGKIVRRKVWKHIS